VTAIPKHAFRNHTALKSIDMADTVTYIGVYAFDGCSTLSEIDFSENLSVICGYAFQGCTSLKIAGLPGSLETIEYRAFQNCTGIQSMVLPDSLTRIGDHAFQECTGMKSVTVPSGVTLIETGTFEGCTGLTSVSLPETLVAINSYAFRNCTALESIQLPDSVSSISTRAFQDCAKLSSVNFPLSWNTVPDYSTNRTDNFSDSSSLYASPFVGCSSLTAIIVPDGVTAIPKHAFRNHTALKRIWIGENVTEIGVYAFDGRGAVTIHGDKDTYAETYANANGIPFVTGWPETSAILGKVIDSSGEGISGISVIILDASFNEIIGEFKTAEDGTWLCQNAVVGNNYTINFSHPNYIIANNRYVCTATKSGITVPEVTATLKIDLDETTPASDFRYTALNGTYATITGYTGSGTTVVIPEQIDGYIIQNIGDNAFRDNTEIVNVVLPSKLETIGSGAFEGCTALEYVGASTGLKSIGTRAFSGCTSLSEVVLPGSLTAIYSYAFRNCTALESIQLPDSVSSISTRAFQDCAKLSSVNFPLSWNTVPDYSTNRTDNFSDGTSLYASPFVGCSSLTAITVPDGVTAIPKHAFRNHTALKTIDMANTVTDIGVYTFEGCSALSDIGFSENLSRIGYSAFRNCTSLTALTLPEKVTQVNGYAFSGCKWLRQIDLNNASVIENYAFSDCTGLVSVILNENLTTINDYAFSSCTNLTAVTVPESVKSCSSKAFNNCGKLTIYCYSNSAAHKMAEANGYSFYLLDDHEHVYELDIESSVTCTQAGSVIYTCTECGYNYIEFVEAYGHDFSEEWTIDKPATCVAEGSKSHHCSKCVERADVTSIPAGGHVYGSWIITRSATVLADGEKYHVCAGCSDTETVTIPKISVDADSTEYGIANFTVVDATNLEPISNAYIFISTETDGDCTLVTDSQGKVTQALPVGKHTVSVYAEGCMTRNLKVNIRAGEQDVPTIGLSAKELVDAKINVKEMTYEEIIDAGIDVNAPGNNHVYKYSVEIRFKPTVDLISIFAYFNGNGEYISGGTDSDDDDSGTGSGAGSGAGANGYVGSYHYNGGFGGGKAIPIKLSDDSRVTVFPVNEYFYLIIYGEVRWLKEMFDVEMLIFNNSLTDTVENCVAELTLPEGVSLADMVYGPQSAVQTIDRIEEGGSASVHWYVRGDKEGYYDVTATLDGVMMPFEEEFHHEYIADNPIKVYAGSAMHMDIRIPDSTFYGDDYTVTIELTNVSGKPIYGLNHAITGLKQGRVTYYSDGTVEEEVYIEEGFIGQRSVDVFYPGDKLVVQVTTQIMFESELMKYQMEKLIGKVDQLEQLMNAYDCFNACADLLEGIGGFVDSAGKALDDFVEKLAVTAVDKIEASARLSAALIKLSGKIKEVDSTTALRIIGEVRGSDVYSKLQNITENEAAYLSSTDADLAYIADAIMAIVDKDHVSKDTVPFDLFDSIRAIIQMIPIRFVVTDVIVTTMEGSTTEIPYSIHYEPVGARYFGVKNVGKLLYSIAVAACGEVDVPWYIGIMGVDDDPTGYHDAVDYIVATLMEMSAVQAVDATGETKFKAWIERKDSGNTEKVLKASESDFALSCTNENAVLNDGVLTFTGGGVIEIIPEGTEGGTLYVEANGELIQTYEIDVVEKHTCSASGWTVEVHPTQETSGMRAKYCDVCGDVIDIEVMEVCEEHVFGEFVTEMEASTESMGIRVRSCNICGCAEYDFTEKLTQNPDDPEQKCGDSLEWSFDPDTGELTITGTGDMYDWTSGEEVPWAEYAERITSVVIAEGVTSIGDNAFSGCTELTSVTVPSSVTSIGKDAFNGCTSLENIYYNGTESEWEDIASEDETEQPADISFAVAGGVCGDDLEWTLYSDGTLVIRGTGSMYDWSTTSARYSPWNEISGRIKSVIICNGVTSIGDSAFADCSSIQTVFIPDSVTSIGEYAFIRCEDLTSIDIPDNVVYIGYFAFRFCHGLTNVYVPAGVTTMSNSAFSGCGNLERIDVDPNNTVFCSVDGAVFSKDGKKIISCPAGKTGSFTIPETVTTIGSSAFDGCEKLTGIRIPDGVTSIGSQAFLSCSGLTEIDIPDSVTSIGSYAFAYTDFTEIRLPEGIMNIGNSTFNGCSNLERINIPDGVTYIGELAFFMCSSMTEIGIPATVAQIDDYAFLGCDSLTDIYYAGTEEQWDAIDAIYMEHELDGVTIHYSSILPVPGDTDGDGEVSLMDATLMRRWLAGWEGVEIDQVNADVNGDGVVNLMDSTILRRYLAGWDNVHLSRPAKQ